MTAPALNTDPKELRKFGFLFAAILILLFALFIPWLRERPLPSWWPFYIAGPIAMLALVWPASLRWFYIGWMKFGAVMGFINTRIIMTLLFFVFFTPIGVLMRLLGKDPLIRGFDRSATTYRIPSQTQSREHLEKPY